MHMNNKKSKNCQIKNLIFQTKNGLYNQRGQPYKSSAYSLSPMCSYYAIYILVLSTYQYQPYIIHTAHNIIF